MPKFLVKTYEILEKGEFSEIIRWSEDGTKLIIQDIKKFEDIILPAYFKHNRFSSFVRQLNMYDFHKVKTQGPECLYQHKLFRRDSKDALNLIRKKRAECKSEQQADQPTNCASAGTIGNELAAVAIEFEAMTQRIRDDQPIDNKRRLSEAAARVCQVLRKAQLILEDKIERLSEEEDPDLSSEPELRRIYNILFRSN